MADQTAIEWCDKTFNPWTGCTKVSPACDHCYAEGWAKRSGHVEWGPQGSRRRTSPAYWNGPEKWNTEARDKGIRYRVFCASLADVFDNHGSITSGWRGDLWHLIARTPHLDWLLLTKRPQNIAKMLPDGYGAPAWGNGWDNVWLGTTVENQTEADRRIPHLLRVPAKVRFLSCEPLLGPVDLTAIERTGGEIGFMRPLDGRFNRLHWIIAGGESGPGARPMHPDWVRDLRDQCAEAGVPFLFKQWGEWLPIDHAPKVTSGRHAVVGRCGSWLEDHDIASPPETVFTVRVGKKRAGRLLDGVTHDAFPEVT